MKNKNHIPRTLLVGDRSNYEEFFTKSNLNNLNIIGFFSLKRQIEESQLKIVGELEEIIKVLAIDQIFLPEGETKTSLKDCVTCCEEMGVGVKRIGASFYKKSRKIQFNRIVKRAVDMVVSIIALIVFAPLMLGISIAIRLDSKGPAIFKQSRAGKGGRVFEMYKFRTMTIDAEERKKDLMDKNLIANGYMFKIKDDPRITRVGKFLRKTSLDEFPQFLNVIKNDMSLVGTRPPTLDEVKKYQRRFWKRLSIKPGITGSWQVNGRSSITDFEKVLEYDLDYIDSWNLLLDMKIILKTIKVLLKPKEAF